MEWKQNSSEEPSCFPNGAYQLSCHKRGGCAPADVFGYNALMTQQEVNREREVREAVQRWYESFPEAAVTEQIAILEGRKADIERELSVLHAEMDRYRRYGQRGRLPVDAERNGEPRPTTRREAVRAIMSEAPGHPFKLAEVRLQMIRRGFMPDTENAGVGLQMVMASMAKRGELQRPEKGYYVLPEKE
jgi:hypothetical protein